MDRYVQKLLPRYRYGVIHPRAHEDLQRGPNYQLYRLLPLDVMEIATGLGGLAVVAAGALVAAQGRIDPGALPLLTLVAMSAFVPVWEIAQVGRQLADTLAATRRLHAVHAQPATVVDGPGVEAVPARPDGGPPPPAPYPEPGVDPTPGDPFDCQ